ncbi:MAG TPA: hypothetical protein VGV35_04855 [Bryobacteraceae bacterium]|nr:hypothetical protein [Bryobacteraceae bacterium]
MLWRNRVRGGVYESKLMAGNPELGASMADVQGALGLIRPSPSFKLIHYLRPGAPVWNRAPRPILAR